jgi:hypothetical protein
MVVEEPLDDSMAVHVRLDGGVTWQWIPAKDEDAVAGVLRQPAGVESTGGDAG